MNDPGPDASPGVPPPLPVSNVRPHRAQTILILGMLGFVLAPFGFAAAWLGKRDLRLMAAGSMDRSGEQLTKLGRTLGLVAGIVWAIKWMILACAGMLVYLNWQSIQKHL